MRILKKQDTPIQNIAYLGIMSAINTIFVLLTSFIPAMVFLLIFVLPLTSTIVTLCCGKKFYPLYIISTVSLCLLATFGIYIFDTFFYVIPSLIIGFFFGILLERKTPSIYILILTTILQFALTYLTFYLVELAVPTLDSFNRVITLLGLKEFKYNGVFFVIFLLIYASIQNTFSYFLITTQVKKFDIEINHTIKYRYTPIIMTILFLVADIIGYMYSAELLYVSVFCSLFLYVYLSINLLTKFSIKNLVLLILNIAISFVLYVLLYQYIEHPKSIILLTIPFVLIVISYSLNISLINKRNTIK